MGEGLGVFLAHPRSSTSRRTSRRPAPKNEGPDADEVRVRELHERCARAAAKRRAAATRTRSVARRRARRDGADAGVTSAAAAA